MDHQERADLSKKILQVIHSLQNDSDPWVDFARIGAPLTAAGVQYKQYGFPKLRPFLNEFQDILVFKDVVPAEGKPPVCYVRPKTEHPLNNKLPVQDAAKGHRKPAIQNGKSILMALG